MTVCFEDIPKRSPIMLKFQGLYHYVREEEILVLYSDFSLFFQRCGILFADKHRETLE